MTPVVHFGSGEGDSHVIPAYEQHVASFLHANSQNRYNFCFIHRELVILFLVKRWISLERFIIIC